MKSEPMTLEDLNWGIENWVMNPKSDKARLLATVMDRDEHIVVLKEDIEQWKKIAQAEKDKREEAEAAHAEISEKVAKATEAAKHVESKAQVAEDLHQALGVRWGDDPYAKIKILLAAEKRLATAEEIIDRLVKFAALGDVPDNKSGTMTMVTKFIKERKDG